MSTIFIGMILVFIGFDIHIGNSTIGLIPDFLGFIFMLNGIREIAGLSNHFRKVVPFIIGMIAYSAVIYVTNLLGVDFPLALTILLGIGSTFVPLVISYMIIMGVKDVEEHREQSLYSEDLHSAWVLLTLFSALSFVVFVVPVPGIIVLLLGFIAAVYYLYRFHKTKMAF